MHYGDTTLTFLENLYQAAEAGRGLTYISAVTVEEKSVWDYNQGNPSGDPGTLGQRGKPRVPLVAVYPKEGTLALRQPVRGAQPRSGWTARRSGRPPTSSPSSPSRRSRSGSPTRRSGTRAASPARR